MDRVRPQQAKRRREDDRALLDRPARSSSDTIRWRPPRRPRTEARHRRPDRRSRGLTTEGPLQKQPVDKMLPACGRHFVNGLLASSMAWSPPALERRSWLVEQARDYAARQCAHVALQLF